MNISGGIKADNKQFEDMNLNIEKSWMAPTRARMRPIPAQPQKEKNKFHVPEHGLLNSQKSLEIVSRSLKWVEITCILQRG